MFLLLPKELSPKSKTLVNFESLCRNIDMSISLIVFRRGAIVLPNSWNSGADSEN